MASNTTNKSILQPDYNAYASNPTGWTGPINDNWGYIDAAFGGVTNLTNPSGTTPVPLSITEYRSLILNITGTHSGTPGYRIPASVGGQWIVRNATSGTVVISSGGAGGGTVSVAANTTETVYSDGSNIRKTTPTVADEIPSGTAMLFAQTAAPTGWTKSTTHDNKALRVVSGTASSGGSVSFTSAFTSQAVSGTVGDTTLTIAQIPAHSHTFNITPLSANGAAVNDVTGGLGSTFSTNSVGGGEAHTHSFTGNAINLAVQYVDVIIATKN